VDACFSTGEGGLLDGSVFKLRVRDWRILCWPYHSDRRVRIYRVQHRSEVYRDFRGNRGDDRRL